MKTSAGVRNSDAEIVTTGKHASGANREAFATARPDDSKRGDHAVAAANSALALFQFTTSQNAFR